ncbi:SRPBCC family protein [Caulobacter sp.]|uniref:SRPBCC family protein n=1 Tax=Caulobacter sp. TaxID=78 RepID=UPI003BAC7260
MAACALDAAPIERIGEVIALLIRNRPMGDPAVVHDTFVLERDYPVSPERVFAAFANPEAKRAWFAEGHNHDLERFEMDFQVGGVEISRYRVRPSGRFAGVVLSSDGTYLDIQPGRRIVIASILAMAGVRLSASLVTLSFAPTTEGTRLTCTHQGAFFENADGPERRKTGWRRLLHQLAEALDR